MRLLFISAWFPYPPSNGSKLRIYNLLQALAQYHEISLLAFTDGAEAGEPPDDLTRLCSEIRTMPCSPYQPTSLKSLVSFFRVTPRAVASTYQPAMEAAIRHVLSARKHDLVIASEFETSAYWRAFRGYPAILEDLELGTLHAKKQQAGSLLGRLRHQLPLLKLKAYLPQLLGRYSACTVVSETERQLLRELSGGYRNIEVVPNGINPADYDGYECAPQPGTLVFSGSFSYFANHDAMVWFLSEVYPLIQAQVPDVHLTITGDHCNLPLPPSNDVLLTGFVDDVRPLIANSWVSLAPIRLGGGTRLKILEAMALGTPVVATSKGAEGLDLQPGQHLLVADTPAAYADAVVSLLRDHDRRQQVAANARRLVSAKYSWSVIMPRFFDLMERASSESICQKYS